MLAHLVADYGAGDLAAAEVQQQLALHLPGAHIGYVPVPPFDTVGAGFCVAQLALTDGPADRLVYHNVAPRADDDSPRPDNEGERLVAAYLPNGVLVVGVDAGWTFSFLRESVDAFECYEVRVPDTGSQFRSRDAFPPLLPRLLARDETVLAARLAAEAVPPVPPHVVAYTDGYGNLKTTWAEPAAELGSRVTVRIGGARATAVLSDATFDVPADELSFAPGSSGWPLPDGSVRRWCELLARGGSAAEIFGFPANGSPVQIEPAR
jgi:S-adenosyl-l-methionine hydroxide adenosyltransferase